MNLGLGYCGFDVWLFVVVCGYQLKQILPEVECHEAEHGKESPAEVIVARVAIVWVSSNPHTCIPLWALPIFKENENNLLKGNPTSRPILTCPHTSTQQKKPDIKSSFG